MPFTLCDKLREEMADGNIKDHTESSGTHRIGKFSGHCSESMGKLQVCLDSRILNKSIKREYFKLPTRKEIMAQLTAPDVLIFPTN